MKLAELKEEALPAEKEPDVENPLPVPPQAQLWPILELIEEIEGKFINQAYKQMFGEFDPKKPQQWGKAAHAVRRELGKVQRVRISELTAIEPKLYGDHLVRLAQGYNPTRGDKLPVVYVLSHGKILGDGNHRVVNELSKGEETVEALVIDFRKHEKWIQD